MCMCSGIDRKERKNLNMTSLSHWLKLTEGPVEQQQRQQKQKDQKHLQNNKITHTQRTKSLACQNQGTYNRNFATRRSMVQ